VNVAVGAVPGPFDGGAVPTRGFGDHLVALPSTVVRRVRRTCEGVGQTLSEQAGVRALSAVPRAARFMTTLGGGPGTLPVPGLSPVFAAQVVMDELMLALAQGLNRLPTPGDYQRVSAELAHARWLFEERGWLDDPASYHRTPPPLAEPSFLRGRTMQHPYERMLFRSGWAPRPEEPGAERWVDYEGNATASVTLLRHRGRPRPWVIAVHGFGMGFPFMDLVGVHAVHLHRDLGLNVAMPVLPLHGPRRINRLSGEAFLGFDLMNTVHGLAQAVWDIRRLLTWIQAQDAPGVAVYGISLGGYVAALLGGLADDLDAVVAGVPVVDFPQLFGHQSPLHIRLRAVEHEILEGHAEVVHRVVSPLAFRSKVPWDRRFVFAGLGDRMAMPEQALALWHHWDEPAVSWYSGNHVGYLWSSQVRAFLDAALDATGVRIEPLEA
jgi:hypothetical protein